MGWTANLIRANREHGKWDVVIEYSDGVKTFQRGYSLEFASDAHIKRLARQEVLKLNTADVEVPTLQKGASIDLTEPVVNPPLPTAEEVAKSQWFDSRRTLSKLLSLAGMGLIPSSDPRIISLQTSLKATWVNSYMDGI